MKKLTLILMSSFMLLGACGDEEKAAAGEECASDADCADGLHCHMHEGEEDHGECEAEEGDDHSDDTA